MKKAGRKNKNSNQYPYLAIGSVGLLLLFVVFISLFFRHSGNLHQELDSGGFTYDITQSPADTISGRPIIFHISVHKDGSVAANKPFNVGISRRQAFGIPFDGNERDSRRTLVSDENGLITYWYTPNVAVNLFDLLGDKESTFFIQPSTDEVAGSGSVHYSFTIMPRWLGWFVF